MDLPEIGGRRGGRILVCHGDDSPDEWVNWLESLIWEFTAIEAWSLELGFDLKVDESRTITGGVLGFCETIGIEIDSSFWEGSMTSGVYHVGWVEADTLRETKRHAKELLEKLRAVADKVVTLGDLEDARDLQQRVDLQTQLKAELQAARDRGIATKAALDAALENDTGEVDRACLRLAIALACDQPERLIAGPLVLWDDAVVYAITKRGGVPLPAGSSPDILLKSLDASGHRVVRVEERTVIGGSGSGPKYRKGTAYINGWSTVWSDLEKRERKFTVDPVEYTDKAVAIHNEISAPTEATRPLL